MDINSLIEKELSNKVLTNTFIKGMNTDTSDMYISNDQYRYAENVRLMTDGDSNTGELRLIEGCTQRWLRCGTSTLSGTILDFNSIRDLGVIILKELGENYPKWSIYAFKYSDIDDNIITTYRIAGPFDVIDDSVDARIWSTDSTNKKTISTVLRWESDNNIKLYIADGIHNLMSIRIDYENLSLWNVGSVFKQVFGYYNTMLFPLKISVSNTTGNILGPKVLYAYILYNKYESSTTLSGCSNVLSLYKNNKIGFKPGERSNKAVDITIPSNINTSLNRIKIYRIAYTTAGQLPTISVVKDGVYTAGLVITDIGNDLSQVSVEELLAEIKINISPLLIESKNDYLFAANVKYNQEDINKLFEKFDARCFSSGSYYMDGNTKTRFHLSLDNNYGNNTLGKDYNYDTKSYYEYVKNIDNSRIGHDAFSGSDNYLYDSSDWGAIEKNTYGLGPCFKWSYNSAESGNMYLPHEVYRFGVRLFDLNGNASSVKWIADIKMGYNGAKGITFTPRNVNTELWDNVKYYEIVLSPRTLQDAYCISSGIIGRMTLVTSTLFCTPMFLTLCNLWEQSSGFYGSKEGASSDTTWVFEYNGQKGTSSNRFLFASPEVCYQHNALLDALKDNRNNLLIYPMEQILFPSELILATGSYDKSIDYLSLTYNNITVSNYSSTLIRSSLDAKHGVYVGRSDANMPHYFINTQTQPRTFGKNNDNGDYESALRYFDTSWFGPYSDENSAFRSLTDGHNTGSKQTVRGFTYLKSSESTYYTGGVDGDYNYRYHVNNAKNIKSFEYIDSADLSDLADDNRNVTFFNKDTILSDGSIYTNWTNPEWVDFGSEMNSGNSNDLGFRVKLYTTDRMENEMWFEIIPRVLPADDAKNGESRWNTLSLGLPMSNGGTYLYLNTESDLIINDAGIGMPPVTIANLVIKSNLPYGGYSAESINNSKYNSYGYCVEKEKAVTIEAGDGFKSNFIFQHTHNPYDAAFTLSYGAAVFYNIPLFTSIDMNGTYSNSLYDYVDNNNIWTQDLAGSVGNRNKNIGITQPDNAYLYNTAYSMNPTAVSHLADDEDEIIENANYDTRVHYSNLKTNNEYIDSWTKFKAMNFTDVDSRYGSITGLKLFKDKLIYLQEHAVGVLSVNDRVIIQDENSAQITLGSGEVLQRYDYITTLYGLKPNQKAYDVSDVALYWWDGTNKEILLYSDGYSITLLLRVKNLQNYVNTHNESAIPTVVYDRKYKEILFSVLGGETIVYNELVGQFTSIYKMCPQFYINIGDKTITTKDSRFYIYNVGNNASTNDDGENLTPLVLYIVNTQPMYNKVFDLLAFGGRFYGGDDLKDLHFTYSTPLKQESECTGSVVTNREYDFRLSIPRNNNSNWGDRMRGKTMQCEIKSVDNNLDFSLQYITTKFRMSWT